MLVLAAPDPARIVGEVVDPSGAPVAAVIHAGDPDGPVAGRTDERGRFSIDRPDPSTDLVIVSPGFAPTRVAAGRVEREAELRVVLQPAGIAEQVTVTAGRRELRGADTPAAASVLTSADLLSMAALAPDDALRFTPGFTLFRRSSSRAANPTTQGVTLRGLSASGASRTLVLAGGVPLNDPFGGWVYWGRVPQAAIDRIEVVRGGASDLYGADAVGGVIQVVPTGASRARVRGSIEGGSLETGRVSLFGAGRHGAFGLGAGVERFSTEGAIIVSEADRGPVDTPAGTEHTSWLLHGDWRVRPGTAIELRVQGFDEKRENGTPLQQNDTNQKQWSLRGSGNAFGGSWQASAYGTHQSYDQSFSAVAQGRATEALTQRQRVPSDMWGGSADWLQAFARTTLLAGVDLREVEGIATETRFVGGQPLAPASAGGRQSTQAAFAQATVALAPAWTLVAGGRIDRWTTHNAVTGADRTKVHPSARAAITWQATDAWSIRGSAYRAFRTPTLNELHRNFRVGDTQTLANDALVAEELTGGEVSALWGRRNYTLRVTAFVTSLDDAIANVTLQTTPTLTTRQRQNAASVLSRGLELEGEWRLDPRWSVTGSAAITGATFGEGPANLDGLDVPQVPRYQLAGGVRFVDPAWLTASFQLRAIGRQYENDLNTLVLDRATVVDAYASRAIAGGVHAFLAIENLFDTVVEVGRTPLVTIGLPRTVRVGARFYWR